MVRFLLLVLAAAIWIGLSISTIRFARIDLPDPPARIEQLLSARSHAVSDAAATEALPPLPPSRDAPPFLLVHAAFLVAVLVASRFARLRPVSVERSTPGSPRRAPFSSRAPPLG